MRGGVLEHPLPGLGVPVEGSVAEPPDGPELPLQLHRLAPGPRPVARAPRRAPADGPTGPVGFGGVHASEAIDGALPKTQNAPRRAPYGLYPELVNGTPFTVRG